MSWQSILKTYTRQMIIDAFVDLSQAVGIWAGINNYPMGGERDFGSLGDRLHSIKLAAFDDKELDLYKQFSKIEDMTNGHVSVNKPLWELYKMLKWREDLQ